MLLGSQGAQKAGPAQVWNRLGGQRLPFIRREQQQESLAVGAEEAVGQVSLAQRTGLDTF